MSPLPMRIMPKKKECVRVHCDRLKKVGGKWICIEENRVPRDLNCCPLWKVAEE